MGKIKKTAGASAPVTLSVGGVPITISVGAAEKKQRKRKPKAAKADLPPKADVPKKPVKKRASNKKAAKE